MEKRLELALGLLMILLVAALAGRGFEMVREERASQGAAAEVPVDGGQELTEWELQETLTVVVDAGHGGVDPGKVGTSGEQEKEINLAIAQKLKTFLEAADVKVVMTREADMGLYGDSDRNKKVADLKARCQIIEDSGAVLVVSIHQNSYQDAAVCGPQVFYYTHSEAGKRLAEKIQANFTGLLGEANVRKAKGNQEYYLLLHVEQPIVIVECGFLSNPEEASRLRDEIYQEKVAWAIHLGVLRYLNGETVA